jgi:hypothetical protein
VIEKSARVFERSGSTWTQGPIGIASTVSAIR